MNVSYFPGCSLEGTAREYRDSTEAVAKRLGISLRELDDWNCCGASAAQATSDAIALGLSARNLRIAHKAGMDLMVPCASCYQRFKQAEKRLQAGEKVEGMPADYKSPRIRYIIEFFWEDIGEKAVKAQVKRPLSNLPVACYYGCLSSRPPAVTDAKRPEDPRDMDKLMQAIGADVRGWSYKTECCGGDLALTRPDVAAKLTERLVDAAIEAGAECLVTGCPLCQANLDMRQSEMPASKPRLPVFYFTELMGLAFGEPSTAKWLHGHMIDPMPLLRQKGLLSHE